jgi:hypothetical protein
LENEGRVYTTVTGEKVACPDPSTPLSVVDPEDSASESEGFAYQSWTGLS